MSFFKKAYRWDGIYRSERGTLAIKGYPFSEMGEVTCLECGRVSHSRHGWILAVGGRYLKVCPGDWVLEYEDGSHEVLKNEEYCDHMGV